MIFNDGQAFKDMDGDVRAPNVLDNLIYRREIPVMIGVFINPGPHARAAGADAVELGRPRHEPARRIQHARRQVRARRRRRADAGADKEYNISKDPDRHGIGGASSGAIAAFTVAWERPERLPQGAQHRRQLREPARRRRLRRHRAAEREEADPDFSAGRPQRQPRRRRRGGVYDQRRDWFFQNVRLMQALTDKGYDVNYTWGINTHGQRMGGADPAGDDALAVAGPSGLDRRQRHGRAQLQRAQEDPQVAP